MEPFATLDELKARLEWELDPGETRIATSALEDLSDEARFYGSSSWLDAASAPRIVRNVVLRAATRYMRNPEGYETSRAGDEMLGFGERPGETAGAAAFNAQEIRTLTTLIRPVGLYTANVSVWGSSTRNVGPTTGYVLPDGGGKPFPMFAEDFV